MMRDDIKAISMVWLSKTGLTNLNSGEGGSNWVDIKKYRWNGKEFPYVSGQAMRFYLKEAIRREIRPEEACVADERGETCGQIERCILCDLFGFMTTLPEVGARTRVSPLKVSPAMGLLPLDGTLATDFLTRRHRGLEAGEMRGDIVNVELSVNLYKGGICLDLRRVGREEDLVQIREVRGTPRRRRRGQTARKSRRRSRGDQTYPRVQLKHYVDDRERGRRVSMLLDAIKDFSDYSKQARLLTDFTPDLVLIALQTNYSHRLQKALELEAEDGVRLALSRLDQVLGEVRGESDVLLAGLLDATVDNAEEVREVLRRHEIEVVCPRAAIDAAKEALGL